jgi:hypothetical protein
VSILKVESQFYNLALDYVELSPLNFIHFIIEKKQKLTCSCRFTEMDKKFSDHCERNKRCMWFKCAYMKPR